MDSEALTVENVAKGFGGRSVLNNINFAVSRGECLTLFGPSGVGKTTLLRLIAGLDDADTGLIRFNGSIASAPHVVRAPNHRGVGMVFQNLALWPHMSALENVEFMLPRASGTKKARLEKAAHLLESVRLEGQQDKHPHKLSRGQQQRTALARALASEPQVLLLDEPFASQDEELKMQLVDLVSAIRRARELTIIYVTHTIEEIPRLASRVALFQNGTILKITEVQDFAPERRRNDSG